LHALWPWRTPLTHGTCCSRLPRCARLTCISRAASLSRWARGTCYALWTPFSHFAYWTFWPRKARVSSASLFTSGTRYSSLTRKTY
jgi:hypothetical protein